MEQVVSRHLSIRGRVQGVSYRASAQAAAVDCGVYGWVRNRHDGSVEAVVSGPASAVEAFIAWARRGPSGARIDHLEVEDSPESGHRGFELRPTV